MLDDIEQHNDIRLLVSMQGGFVGNPRQHRQPGSLAVNRGICRELNSRNTKIFLGFMQEKAIGTSDFQQSSAVTPLANESYRPSKLSPQYRFGSHVIVVTVRLPSGEILCGVVTCWVKSRSLRLTKPADPAPQNIAALCRQPPKLRSLGQLHQVRRTPQDWRRNELAWPIPLPLAPPGCRRSSSSLFPRWASSRKVRGRQRRRADDRVVCVPITAIDRRRSKQDPRAAM